MILQRQIEQRVQRRKCLDADIRLNCKSRGHAVRSNIQAGTSSPRSACDSSSVQRKTTKPSFDGTMNANSATKLRMMPVKNLAKNGPVNVLKPRCTTTSERIDHWIKMRGRSGPQHATPAGQHATRAGPRGATQAEAQNATQQNTICAEALGSKSKESAAETLRGHMADLLLIFHDNNLPHARTAHPSLGAEVFRHPSQLRLVCRPGRLIFGAVSTR